VRHSRELFSKKPLAHVRCYWGMLIFIQRDGVLNVGMQGYGRPDVTRNHAVPGVRTMTQLRAVSTTYEPFSKEPEYIECNRAFVERLPLDHVDRFLDLACGTGTVSALLLERYPQAHLNGIDHDPVQIELATDTWTTLGHTVRGGYDLTDDYENDKPVVVLGGGSCDDLQFPDETFDCVTIGDHCAINAMSALQTHLYEDRIMKVGRVELGRGVTVGAGATVLYDTKVGDFAQLGCLTVVMKGETIPASSAWTGAPAQPTKVMH